MTSDFIRVWAPRAASVTLVLPAEDRTVPMQPEPNGWWVGPPLAPGTDYAFSLDGGPARPDPRSPWQPEGVHAPSRVYDAGAFPWPDDDWAGRDIRGSVVYEIHVGTFTQEGTLDAAIERLDHVVDLGVDMVELMPLAAFAGRSGWGYDGVALYAVHEPYGGPAALQRFVAAAHARGLAVCLDVVYNHLGPSGSYVGEFGPYFTGRHRTPWGEGLDIDGPEARAVRDFVIDNAVRWFSDFRIDALRLDAVHALADDSERHLLAELSDTVADLARRLGRPLSLVAESDLNDARMVTPTRDGGLGMQAQWADDVHHAIHALMTGERQGYYVDFGTLAVLERVMTRVFVHEATYSTYRRRVWGAPVPDDIDGHAFVVFASNHDQIGNRGLGDRPSSVLTDGQLAIEAAVVLAGPYTPMLFMGEEWGARTPWQFFTDHAEPALAEAIREGREREFSEFGWDELYGGDVEVPDPQTRATVEASRLDWTEPAQPGHARLLAFYRDLIALRRRVPDLASGDRSRTTLDYDDGARWFTLHRGGCAVVANLAPDPTDVPLVGAEGRDVLLAWEPVARAGDVVSLPGHAVVVLGPRQG